VQQCDRVAQLADLVSGAGPLKVTVTRPDHVAIKRGVVVVADVDEPDLAAFHIAAPSWLRTLAEAVATVYAEHAPPGPGERCPHCGTSDPCHTRRLLDVRILRGPTGAGTDPGTTQ
jgi:hypothetical protein